MGYKCAVVLHREGMGREQERLRSRDGCGEPRVSLDFFRPLPRSSSRTTGFKTPHLPSLPPPFQTSSSRTHTHRPASYSSMGRPRDRRRKRSRARAAAEEDDDEVLFPVGAAVEVRVDDPGFEGSLYEATVEGYLPSGRGYVVAYDTLASREDGGGSPLREHVAAAAVRPRPPAAAPPRREFALHETVDAFHNEGWWAGVVQAVPPAAGGDARVYTVCFPTTRETLQFDETRLRPRLVFLALGDRWVPAAQAPVRNPLLSSYLLSVTFIVSQLTIVRKLPAESIPSYVVINYLEILPPILDCIFLMLLAGK